MPARLFGFFGGLAVGFIFGGIVGFLALNWAVKASFELDFCGDTTSGRYIQDREARIEACGYDRAY